MKKNLWLVPFLSILIFVACSRLEEEKPDPVTLTWYINYSWFDKSWGLDAVSQYITEQTGIQVEYVIPWGDESQQIQQFLSQGITADIITLDAWDNTYGELIQKNALVPLNLLAEEYQQDFFQNTQEETVSWYTQGENIYVYPNASYPPDTSQNYSNQSFLVRQDIYKAIGSPDMSTPEGFLQALEDAVAYCPEVEGKPLIPLGLQEFTATGNPSIDDMLQNFLAIPFEEEGQVVDRFTHPDYVLWLETLNEANRRGLLAQDVFLDKRVQMEEKIAKGQYFAMLYQWSDCTEQLQEINSKSPEQNYIAIDGPKNSQGDNHTLAGSSIQGWTVTGISSSSTKQEEAITLLTYLMSEEGQKLIFLGVEGQGYTMEEGVPQLLPEAQALLLENRSAYDEIYGGVSTHWPMMNNLYADEMGYHFPSPSYLREIQDWSRAYTENFSLYADQEFSPPAYEAKRLDDQAKGNLLPQLLLAETTEDFWEIWEDYVISREENNFQSVLEARQRQLEQNKQRMG